MNAENPPNSGRTSILLMLLLVVAIITGATIPAVAADFKEIRVMAPFQDLSKVLPSGDRAVIIPEEDYNYLKDIAQPVAPEIDRKSTRLNSSHRT